MAELVSHLQDKVLFTLLSPLLKWSEEVSPSAMAVLPVAGERVTITAGVSLGHAFFQVHWL